MKRSYWIIVSLLFSVPVWADNNLEPLLNKVTLQLQAEQWVPTKTALVSIGVNAAVASRGIEQVQADVQKKLATLSSKADWHLVSYDRQLDKSGLETIQISAQARLPQPDLLNLRDSVKTMSKPGETYTIENIQFTPDDDEIKQSNITLRNNLYEQAKAEIDALNKIYPEQKYYLHQINFITVPPVMPMAMMRSEMAMPKMGGGLAAPMPIGNKVELHATVVVAAMPEQVTQKLAHASTTTNPTTTNQSRA